MVGVGARAHGRERSSTTARARTWRAAWPRALALASRRGGRALAGDLGLFEVDEFWLGPVVEELEPRALLLGNLFRDQLDRYGELETIADRWAAVVGARRGRARAGPERRRPARGRPRACGPTAAGARRRRGHSSAWTTTASPTPSSSTPPTPSTAAAAGIPYVYDAAYLAHLGHYHCPNCGARRPEPTVVARDVELRGIRSAAFTLHTPAGTGARRAAAARPLQRLQRRRRRGAVPRARRAARRRGGRAGGGGAGLRPRGDRRARRAPDLHPARQEPRRRQRGAAHAGARGRRARPVRRAQRPHGGRARRVVGVGRRLGAARPVRAAHDLLGHARGGAARCA